MKYNYNNKITANLKKHEFMYIFMCLHITETVKSCGQ